MDLRSNLLLMIPMDHLPLGQSNPGIGCDHLSHLRYAQRNRRVVVVGPRRRRHCSSDVSHLRIVQNPLKAVSDLDPPAPGIHHKQHQDSAVTSLCAHLPLFFQRNGKLLN